MALIADMSDAAAYWFDKIEEAKAELGFEAVYYGDQERLATTPVVCVEPNIESSALKGATRRTAVTISLYFIIYHSSIRSPQVNRREADKQAKVLKDFLHADPRMNETVIHSMVTRIESGFTYKENTLVRATRVTFEAETQAQLPN